MGEPSISRYCLWSVDAFLASILQDNEGVATALQIFEKMTPLHTYSSPLRSLSCSQPAGKSRGRGIQVENTLAGVLNVRGVDEEGERNSQ